jgi:CDP-4-dehydro-6-deoxyglucose reductase, E3
MPPQVFTAKLADKFVHNDKFIQLQFELVSPNRMEFQAGQYVSIAVSKDGYRRSYSIVSTPDNNHGFDLLVGVVPNGLGTEYLTKLDFGAEIQALGPMGTFVVKSEDPKTPLVFVAAGSGIAPLRAMLFDQLQRFGDERQMTLYWGLRHEVDMCWEEDLKDLVAQHPNVTFHPVISKAQDEWPLCRGRVTDCLYVHELDPNAEYYVCGSSQMINDVIKVLTSRGIVEEKIVYEKFY